MRRRPGAAVAGILGLDRRLPSRRTGSRSCTAGTPPRRRGARTPSRRHPRPSPRRDRRRTCRGSRRRRADAAGSSCCCSSSANPSVNARAASLLVSFMRAEAHGVLDRREQLRDLAAAVLADLDEPVVRDRAQRLGAVDVADDADDDAREHADRQQHDEQDRIDRQTPRATAGAACPPTCVGGTRAASSTRTMLLLRAPSWRRKDPQASAGEAGPTLAPAVSHRVEDAAPAGDTGLGGGQQRARRVRPSARWARIRDGRRGCSRPSGSRCRHRARPSRVRPRAPSAEPP